MEDPRTVTITVADVPLWECSPGTQIARLFRRFNETGGVRSPWFFSHVAPASGRFDLPAPHGTCYFASSPVGAWLEVFGGVRLVAAGDVRRRQVATATRTGGPLSFVDLSAPGAAAAGVTLDVQSGSKYAQAQEVAAEAAGLGAAGMRALARHDPSGVERTIAVFGRAGAPSRQFGWKVARRPAWGDVGLLAALAERGIHVRDIPYDLPVTPPPTPAAPAHPANGE